MTSSSLLPSSSRLSYLQGHLPPPPQPLPVPPSSVGTAALAAIAPIPGTPPPPTSLPPPSSTGALLAMIGVPPPPPPPPPFSDEEGSEDGPPGEVAVGTVAGAPTSVPSAFSSRARSNRGREMEWEEWGAAKRTKTETKANDGAA